MLGGLVGARYTFTSKFTTLALLHKQKELNRIPTHLKSLNAILPNFESLDLPDFKYLLETVWIYSINVYKIRYQAMMITEVLNKCKVTSEHK
jgi:hypothetical protein